MSALRNFEDPKQGESFFKEIKSQNESPSQDDFSSIILLTLEMFDLNVSDIRINRTDVSDSYLEKVKQLCETDLSKIKADLEDAIKKLDKEQMIEILKRFQEISR